MRAAVSQKEEGRKMLRSQLLRQSERLERGHVCYSTWSPVNKARASGMGRKVYSVQGPFCLDCYGLLGQWTATLNPC